MTRQRTGDTDMDMDMDMLPHTRPAPLPEHKPVLGWIKGVTERGEASCSTQNRPFSILSLLLRNDEISANYLATIRTLAGGVANAAPGETGLEQPPYPIGSFES
ncbi:hypothetical protein E6O75_ATG11528 [Venturia nashicola]|uniref:Uncharacterized protein n=1 Tax=Venturia nashicola TaxID=86259 RepID=A0A4Z1NL72_9PEZI|nr:hypothetical protein E6O75_ATG11528 [Venturia nashicola]